MAQTDNLEKEYQLLKLIEQQPQLTQRELAAQLGVSLGKTHYVLTALIDRGLVKAGNFARSDNKRGYAYVLTPAGLAEKIAITQSFLKRKMGEYEQIKADIKRLNEELGS